MLDDRDGNEQLEWQEDLPFEAQQRREVFAHFGLTMYWAQCLEVQIGLLLASMYNQEFLRVPPEDRDAFFDRESKKTLGRMKRDLGNKLPSTLENRLSEAVELRNWLVHSYFSERGIDILTLEGREKMIFELQEKAAFFKELDVEFTAILEKWFFIQSISKEELESEVARFFRENNVELDNVKEINQTEL